MTLNATIERTNWNLLALQKAALLRAIDRAYPSANDCRLLEGLLNFVEALQDAAETDGFPVVWLEDDGED
jgi:hypothetical protein